MESGAHRLAMSGRIILVDDASDLATLDAHLAALGHELVRAPSAALATALFEGEPPALVLLNPTTPGIGLELLHAFRAISGDVYVPVIVLGRLADRDARRRALEAGADDFLDNPLDLPFLGRRARTLLALKDSRDALVASNAALAARNATLEIVQRQQREVVGFIIHDLKNPLSVVRSNLDWARTGSGPLDRDIDEALGEASEAAGRLEAMVQDLLVVSRLEQSAFEPRREAVLVGELLRDVVRLYDRMAQRKSVVLRGPDDLDLQVRADRALLRRVIENILDNSLRYTPAHGRVAVVARGSGDVEIAVSNTGPSIPPSDRERIFEKFARGEGERLSHANSGLGLYFCKRAVEAIGGRIEVVETSEWPTSFVVHLPAA
jgi:two-component system, sensor histidine kinase and response regulator